eukprot:3725787-Rhodomonas_salina.2
MGNSSARGAATLEHTRGLLLPLLLTLLPLMRSQLPQVVIVEELIQRPIFSVQRVNVCHSEHVAVDQNARVLEGIKVLLEPRTLQPNWFAELEAPKPECWSREVPPQKRPSQAPVGMHGILPDKRVLAGEVSAHVTAKGLQVSGEIL